MRYKVSKIDYRENSDEVAIILKSEEDSFAVWLPREEFEKLDTNELHQLLHECIRERIKLLKKKKKKELNKNKVGKVERIVIEV